MLVLKIKDILKTTHPETIRLFLLSNHYRSPIDFSEQNLLASGKALDKVYAVLKRLEEAGGLAADADTAPPGQFWKAFCEAMDDDFNTAKGIGILFTLVTEINRLLDGGPTAPAGDPVLPPAVGDLVRIGRILGILQQPWSDYFAQQSKTRLAETAISAESVDRLVAERSRARQNKDWQRADEIRNQLEKAGILLEDKAEGTQWKVAP